MAQTTWAEVICDYALPLIDDVRLSDQLAVNPALFFRRMSVLVSLALPSLSRPQELYSYVTSGMTKPAYDDFEWTSTAESTGQETEVETGLIGYQLYNASIRKVDKSGMVTLTPTTAVEYDPETGIVKFPVQDEVGVEYDIDFYTDGTFGNTMTEAQKRLLAFAIAVVWDERFSRNWLNIQQKDKDSSFDTVNESNYMRETQSRLASNRSALHDELRKYEQDLAYSNMSAKRSLKFV